MAEVNLDDLKLEDLLFIVGGSIFQGSTADDIELEVFTVLLIKPLISVSFKETVVPLVPPTSM